MQDEYWRVEIRRLLGVLILGLVIGYISGYWQASLLFTACGYIGWILFKLRQLQYWLVRGQPAEAMPDSDGAWEQITYLIHRAKQKSESRKRKQRELLARFNNIMSALPDAAILLDQEHRIQWVNRAAGELLGIEARHDAGQRIDNLLRLPELNALLESHSDQELRFVSPRDHTLTFVARLLPVQKNLHLLNVRDISQRVRLQETRRAFFANASHELRTPLTVFTGYLELIASDPELPAHLEPAVQQSREQAQRMQDIIEDMLALARLENDQRPRKQDMLIDMPALLRSHTAALRETMAAGSHTLDMDIDRNLKIYGNEQDVLSVIHNLTGNAIRHTPPGAHIHIEWKLENSGHARLTVEDNGPGIPAQHILHLTERFYRVDRGRSRDKGGTGLGLAIVKHVMMNHNGVLDITSRPGQTRFMARFPPERVV